MDIKYPKSSKLKNKRLHEFQVVSCKNEMNEDKSSQALSLHIQSVLTLNIFPYMGRASWFTDQYKPIFRDLAG